MPLIFVRRRFNSSSPIYSVFALNEMNSRIFSHSKSTSSYKILVDEVVFWARIEAWSTRTLSSSLAYFYLATFSILCIIWVSRWAGMSMSTPLSPLSLLGDYDETASEWLAPQRQVPEDESGFRELLLETGGEWSLMYSYSSNFTDLDASSAWLLRWFDRWFLRVCAAGLKGKSLERSKCVKFCET